jgi:hypothetical protein
MKPSLKISTAFLFLMTSIFLLSCGKDLSRDDAKELIIQKINLPQTETLKIEGTYFVSQQGRQVTSIEQPYFSQYRTMLEGLQSKGLITINLANEDDQASGIYFTWAYVTLTDEGKKYLISESNGNYEVKTSEITFGEVTGILINETRLVD